MDNKVTKILEGFSIAQREMLRTHLMRRCIPEKQDRKLRVVFDLLHQCDINCIGCGTNAQYVGEQKVTPKQMTIDQVRTVLEKIRDYGAEENLVPFIIFGGGEPLLHSTFIHEVCGKMNPEWRRYIETSLYAEWEQISILLRDIDYWIIDIKDIDTEIYSSYTGHDNKKVLHNLDGLIKQIGVQNVCVRVPRIPGYNSAGDCVRNIKYLKERYGQDLKTESFAYTIPQSVF